MPVELPEDGMAFCSQKESTCALALVTDEPVVNAVEFSKEFKGELGHLLMFADEAGLNCIEAGLRVLLIVGMKMFEFVVVFVEQ